MLCYIDIQTNWTFSKQCWLFKVDFSSNSNIFFCSCIFFILFSVRTELIGDGAISRLAISQASVKHSGIYTCAVSDNISQSLRLHIIDGKFFLLIWIWKCKMYKNRLAAKKPFLSSSLNLFFFVNVQANHFLFVTLYFVSLVKNIVFDCDKMEGNWTIES